MTKNIGVGVGIMIMKNNKVLLGKRYGDPQKASSLLDGAGTWTFPGGKVDFGETFEDAAIRETKEECGITLTNVKVICLNNDLVDGAHFVTIGLFSDDFSGSLQVLEPDKITCWDWFDLDKLPEPLYFPTKNLLNNYRKKQFYLSE